MALTAYQKFSYKVFGGLGKKLASENYRLKDNLLKARIELLPEAWLAYVCMNILLTAVGCTILWWVLFLMMPRLIMVLILKMVNPYIILFTVYFLLLGLAPLIFVVAIAYFVTLPTSRAKSRKKDIDTHLPYAANFIAAMAAAHATPEMIFKSLGKQEGIYREVSKEAQWIYRDTKALGADLITALKNAAMRSPSEKFGDFAQGIIGTLTAGGDLKVYLTSRAEYYMRENRREQRDFIETLGILGESYLVVAVAMPLLLLIMMVVMSWVGGGGFAFTPAIMGLIIFIVLPIIHLAYAFAIWSASPKL